MWLCARSKESAESALGFLFCDLGALVIGSVFWPVVIPFLFIESKIQTAEIEQRENRKEDAPEDLSLLHGKIGITKTPQSPSGRIVIDDREYESQSVHAHIEKGTSVRVVGYSMRHLKIEPAEGNFKTAN
jgi:membrane-bound ClpP family serine protease